MAPPLSARAARFEGPTYALLRVIAGLMFSVHGMQKLFGWLGGHQAAVGTQGWVGGIVELVAGLLIAFGLFTRIAAFIASGQMAVAYIQFSWKLALGGFFWIPNVNKGELAVLYCFIFLFIAARGPGYPSLDRRLRGV